MMSKFFLRQRLMLNLVLISRYSLATRSEDKSSSGFGGPAKDGQGQSGTVGVVFLRGGKAGPVAVVTGKQGGRVPGTLPGGARNALGMVTNLGTWLTGGLGVAQRRFSVLAEKRSGPAVRTAAAREPQGVCCTGAAAPRCGATISRVGRAW